MAAMLVVTFVKKKKKMRILIILIRRFSGDAISSLTLLLTPNCCYILCWLWGCHGSVRCRIDCTMRRWRLPGGVTGAVVMAGSLRYKQRGSIFSGFLLHSI